MRMLGITIVFLSMQLHGMPAAADLPDVRCWHVPGTQRPHVRTVDGTVRVDNRCNERGALVVVWRMYENSSETFRVPPGAYVVEPTLHTGRLRVWVIFDYEGDSYTYRKRMRYSA